MKNSVLFSFLLFPAMLFSQNAEKKIRSEIKHVTVYLSGASVNNTATANVDPGQSDLVFENLAPGVDMNSISAKGEGPFTILSVSFRNNYLSNQPKSKEIVQLEDSLEGLQLKINVQANLRNVYESEKSMLLANKNIGGQNTGVSALELEKIANLLRTRLTDLSNRQMECTLKEKKLNEEIVKVQNQLAQLNAKRNVSTGEIVVTVAADAAVANAKFSLTYNVHNAGWSPVYDLRAADSKSPVKLEYRANIWQNTGVDWKNVKLSVSTGNPSQGGTKPTIMPWWLSFYTASYGLRTKDAGGKQVKKYTEYQNAPASISLETTAAAGFEDARNAGDFTTVSESQTSVLYDISIPYNIASDNIPHSVSIQSFTIPASYRYYCAPKLDPDAFLLAKITGWDQYNLQSGTMNVFFEGTFVGKSYLDTRSTNDTLDISLGRDKNVIVQRTNLKEFSEKKIIGLNKKELRTYEITLRNKKKQDIDIDIEDQIPLSTNSEIEIEALETSGAKYNKETGLLQWSLKAATGEEKKFRFGFSVKYPKDKVLSNL